MNTITDFFSSLYDVYYSCFVIGGKSVPPAHFAVLLAVGVAASLWYGLVREPRFVQRHVVAHGGLDGIDESLRWFRLGHFSVFMILATSCVLAYFWP